MITGLPLSDHFMVESAVPRYHGLFATPLDSTHNHPCQETVLKLNHVYIKHLTIKARRCLEKRVSLAISSWLFGFVISRFEPLVLVEGK